MESLIIQIARKEIGVKEDPADSNIVKYNDWFYGGHEYGHPAWCGAFVSWCYDQAKMNLGVIDYRNGYAGVPYAVNHISKWGKLVTVPQPGDIVFFDWQGDGKFDHTGLFVKDNGKGLFQSIEGNTAFANDSNGGMVMQRERNYKNCIFVRPNSLK